MRNRRAICFFLLLSGMFAAALALLSIQQCQTPSRAEQFFELPVDRVDVVKFSRKGGNGAREHFAFVRKGGEWRIESPISAGADESAIKQLLDALAFSERGSVLSARDMEKMGRTYRDFGLSEPAVELTVAAGLTRESCSFGRVVPSGGEYYARRGGMTGVFTVSATIVEELFRPLGDFRRRRLFTISPRDVIGMGVKNAGDAFTKVARSGGSWRLTEPADAPADGKAADAMVAALCSACVIEYTDAVPGTGRGLNDEEGCAVSLRGSLGEVERVLFGFAAGSNTVWALTREGAVVQVDAALKELCLAGRKALEDTRMFPVDESLIRMVSISEGFPAYVVSRKDAESPWRMVSPVDAQADDKVVGELLSQILSVRGGDVVESGNDNTFSVAVGTAATNFPACVINQELLPKGFSVQDLRDKTVVRYHAAKIRKIEVRTAAGVEWDSTGSEELRKAIAKGIVAKSVVAVSPSADDFSRCGFSTPAYTINFILDDEVSAMRKLLIGAVAPGGGRYIAIGGSDAIFAVSADTVSVLTRPAEKITEEQR